MADQILPEGLRFFNKRDTSPDFVVGALVITLDDLKNFVETRPELLTEYNGKKQLKLQILKSKEGKLYSSVDTWKPDGNTQTQSKPLSTLSNKDVEPLENLPF